MSLVGCVKFLAVRDSPSRHVLYGATADARRMGARKLWSRTMIPIDKGFRTLKTTQLQKKWARVGERIGVERQSNSGDVSSNVDASDVEVSIFRFTLGIPGLDDSELPRIAGILFGGLLFVNHVFSLGVITDAQQRSEFVGVVLAAVAAFLPSIGQRLNEKKINKIKGLAGRGKQMFALSSRLKGSQKQELAWASYALLRNTNSLALLVCLEGEVVCARGCWECTDNQPSGESQGLDWLTSGLQTSPIKSLSTSLYVPYNAGSEGWGIIPKVAASLLVKGISRCTLSENGAAGDSFILLVSDAPRAYQSKDRAWVALLAEKLAYSMQL